jgi:hypothetical protein
MRKGADYQAYRENQYKRNKNLADKFVEAIAARFMEGFVQTLLKYRQLSRRKLRSKSLRLLDKRDFVILNRQRPANTGIRHICLHDKYKEEQYRENIRNFSHFDLSLSHFTAGSKVVSQTCAVMRNRNVNCYCTGRNLSLEPCFSFLFHV